MEATLSMPFEVVIFTGEESMGSFLFKIGKLSQ